MSSLIRTVFTIIFGLFIGAVIFIAGIFVLYLISTSHESNISVNDCKDGVMKGLRQLNKDVESRWFDRHHHDVLVHKNGPCLYYQFYPVPGALYIGQDINSGMIAGVAMTESELRNFADTVSVDTDFETMLKIFFKRAESNPAPVHKF